MPFPRCRAEDPATPPSRGPPGGRAYGSSRRPRGGPRWPAASALAPDAGVGFGVGGARADGAEFGAPAGARHHTGLDQVQAVEEPGDLRRAAQEIRVRAALVVAVLGGVERLAHVAAVIQR